MNPIEACSHFPSVGPVLACDPLGGGHIHRTWVVSASNGTWVVQACNTEVFPDMDAVMANISFVSTGAPETAPSIAHDRATLWRDREGVVWRVRPHVAGRTISTSSLTVAQVHQLGRGLGAWHRRVAPLDPSRLVVTLPGFHDPTARLAHLDSFGRGGGERARVDRFRWLADAASMRPPMVPTRVAHFDAKADNFVVGAGGAVLAVIDLDTVMPGSWLWDVGDLARSATGTRPEDEPDGMAFVGDRFAALVDGYRHEIDPVLTDAERAGLRLAPLVVTFEQAVRFLADHLGGDVYYRVARPGHNLDRCRAQLALLESMADQML